MLPESVVLLPVLLGQCGQVVHENGHVCYAIDVSTLTWDACLLPMLLSQCGQVVHDNIPLDTCIML